MSKPPHKLDLPSLDELFDDTFERNARRVLHSAAGLEQKYGESQLEAEPVAATQPARKTRPKAVSSRNSSWVHAEVGPAVGLLLIGMGLISISFAVTLFVLNLTEPNSALQPYIWPTGLAGQLTLLLGFGLRISARHHGSGQADTADDEPVLQRSSLRHIRWDKSHAPSSRTQPQHAGKT